MPLVQIDLSAARSPTTRRAIADGVHQALVDAIGIPAGDRFQILTPHQPDELIFDPAYLDVARQDVVCIQITLLAGRSQELKLDLYRRITDNLTGAGVRSEDVFVTLTENTRDSWSVGNGQAQLLGLDAAADRAR